MYTDYENHIKEFIYTLDIEKYDFKSNPHYTAVLEHTHPHYGGQYLSYIQSRFSSLYNSYKNMFIDLCIQNDKIGKPVKYNFENFMACSPSNLRYIFHSLLILEFMKECNISNVDIIEIGGGYGGLCFYMHNLSPLFEITINTYTIFDLPYPMLLQEKYLKNLGIEKTMNFESLINIKNLKKNSFLISNYAFSEFSYEIQQKYSTQVINPYTSYGFLAWNAIDVYDFVDKKNIYEEVEYPLTYTNNKYVRYN